MSKLPLSMSWRPSFVSIATPCSANVAMAANVDGLSYRGRCRRQGALTGEPQPQAFLPPDWLSSDALLLSPAGGRGEAFNSLFTPGIALLRCFQALHSAHGQRAVAAPCRCTVRRHLRVLPHRQQQPGLVDGVLNNCFRRMAVCFCVCCSTASKKGRAGLSGARGGATRRESRFINRIDRPARRG